jgi:hypothetical protein
MWLIIILCLPGNKKPAFPQNEWVNYSPLPFVGGGSTDVEMLLWRYLRDRQMEGLKFRRQQPIGRYIVTAQYLGVIVLDSRFRRNDEMYLLNI